mmetsp:Transcript_48746/g.116033  ORF Transcript_48746/g.116033 Transcript_48746/m.116033 type:complete len:190 (-) Transcript_48746:105-674(-)
MADDHYAMMGLDKSATADELKAAYKKLCLKYHPDKAAAGQEEASAKKFRELQDAFAVVGDEAKRNRYDEVQVHRLVRDRKLEVVEKKRKADELEMAELMKPRPLPQLREEFAKRNIVTPVQVGRVSAACKAADPVRFKVALKLTETKAQSTGAALRQLIESWGEDNGIPELVAWMTEKGAWAKANKVAA